VAPNIRFISANLILNNLIKVIYIEWDLNVPIRAPYGIGGVHEIIICSKLNEFSNAYFSNELPNVKV
jgi:hypothetical protein